jgi:hypothetical protein
MIQHRLMEGPLSLKQVIVQVRVLVLEQMSAYDVDHEVNPGSEGQS